MVIYWDVVLIINFALNFMFIEIIHMLFHEKISLVKCVLSSICSSLLLFGFLLDYHIFLLFKIIGGCLLVFIAVKFVSISKYLIQVTLYYALEFSLIGIVNSFHLQGIMLMVGTLIIAFLFMVQNYRLYFIKTASDNYEVIVTLNCFEYHINGFLDTGNNSLLYGKPIVYLSDKYFDNKLKQAATTKVQTIGNEQSISCFKPKRFIIIQNNKKIHKDVYIAFCSLQNVDCLLNTCLLK